MKEKYTVKNKLLTFLLLYFVVFTTYFSIITFSKYVGRITETGNQALIAKWEVSSDDSDNNSNVLNMVIGNTTQSYTISVTSLSETKAYYSIILLNVPSNLRVKLDNGTYQTPENNTITFSNVGYINANDTVKTKTHTLTFNVPLETSAITASNITLNVTFNQANPNES